MSLERLERVPPPSSPDEVILEQEKNLPRVILWKKIRRVFLYQPSNPGSAPEPPPPIGQTSFQKKLPLK